MYYYIKGFLAEKGEGYIVVDAGGVGYLINTSMLSAAEAGNIRDEITIYTYLHVREDVMDLYGFTSVEEKNMFINLMTVSGVGPKAALAVLSALTPARLAVAVVTDDTKSITKAQGVGAKMAQRIVMELKDKIKAEDFDFDNDEAAEILPSDSKKEAVSALVALGYSSQEAQKAVSGVDGTLPVEEIVKKALSSLF